MKNFVKASSSGYIITFLFKTNKKENVVCWDVFKLLLGKVHEQ